jgi:Arc/MetJ family transcription regulator
MLYSTLVRRRTTLDVDDELLARAQAALGTTGLKETVDAALREAIRRSLRQRLGDRISTGAGVDRSAGLLDETRPSR